MHIFTSEYCSVLRVSNLIIWNLFVSTQSANQNLNKAAENDDDNRSINAFFVSAVLFYRLVRQI